MKANMTIYWNVWTEFNYYNIAYDYGLFGSISILIIKTKKLQKYFMCITFVES